MKFCRGDVDCDQTAVGARSRAKTRSTNSCLDLKRFSSCKRSRASALPRSDRIDDRSNSSYNKAMNTRTAKVERNTKETQITVSINLDGTGQADLQTGVPFLDHMLDQLARHGMMDVTVHAKGDLHIDAHHTVEDIGITLGQAFKQAVGDKAGINRYGHSYVPLDEALSRVVIDLSGRPGLEFHVPFTRAMIGTFDVDLTHEFFQGFVNHALVTLHIDNLRGENAHHQCETVFKAFARALRMACERDARAAGVVVSTKGVL
jgi:imidazoleglycerol-phosphate dehydratase